MINNSVTHLRSYKNLAIADIAGNSAQISPETQRERQYRRAMRRCLRIERRYRRIEWRVFECFVMFQNVLRVFHNVLRVLHDVLLVVHYVL